MGVALLESRDMSASRASLSILDDDSCSCSDSQQLDDVDDDVIADDARGRYNQRRIAADVRTVLFTYCSIFLDRVVVLRT